MLKITNDPKEFVVEDKCVVYFTADWCGPCKQLKPQYGKLSVMDNEINYYLVDVDKLDRETLEYYNIKSIPQVFVMKDGEISKKIESKTAEKMLEEIKS